MLIYLKSFLTKSFRRNEVTEKSFNMQGFLGRGLPRNDISKSSNSTSVRCEDIYSEKGFTITELLVVLVIIGVLVLLALPRLMPVVTKAKTTEAKLNLKQVYMLQKAYKFEYDKYSNNLSEIGFEQEKLVTEGGNARYKITVSNSDINAFTAIATAVVDFDDDGTFNVWEVNQDGTIKEVTPD